MKDAPGGISFRGDVGYRAPGEFFSSLGSNDTFAFRRSDLLDRLRAMNDALPVVVISGHGTISTAVDATKKGAFDFIEKPVGAEQLIAVGGFSCPSG